MDALLGQAQDLRGFLPTRGSFMLDFVFLAMFAILPVLMWSIYLARYRRAFELHKWVQTGLAVVLLVAVLAFELELRFVTNWEELAEPSPYFEPDRWNLVWYSLIVHLCFAIPTPLLWVYVIVQAWRRFPRPANPSDYSREHTFWARCAAAGMWLTALTGWGFYWLAFIA